MRKALAIMIFLGLAATPALAQKVTIDYAHGYDFKAVKTFQYVNTPESNVKDQLMDERIKNAIIAKLEAAGLKQVEENGDIDVTYHVTSQKEQVFNTTGFGYGGWGAGWGGWGGMGTATTTTSTYTEGTLIVDAYDAKDKKLIWRGTGTVTVKSKPEKQTQQIDAILDKLGVKWSKILKGQGE